MLRGFKFLKINMLKNFFDNNFLWHLFQLNRPLPTCPLVFGSVAARLILEPYLILEVVFLDYFSDIILIPPPLPFFRFCYFRLIFCSLTCNAALALYRYANFCIKFSVYWCQNELLIFLNR